MVSNPNKNPATAATMLESRIDFVLNIQESLFVRIFVNMVRELLKVCINKLRFLHRHPGPRSGISSHINGWRSHIKCGMTLFLDSQFESNITIFLKLALLPSSHKDPFALSRPDGT